MLRAVAVAAMLALGAADAASAQTAAAAEPSQTVEAQRLMDDWGVEIEAVRVTAGGHVVRVNYRVHDAAKAAPLLDRRIAAFLLDQASGVRVGVPTSPKIGMLRQNTRSPRAGRSYFILFGNPQGRIKPGAGVSLIIGDFRADDLRVEGKS